VAPLHSFRLPVFDLTSVCRYHIEPSESDAAFFPGRRGQIILNGRYDPPPPARMISRLFCFVRSIGVIGAIHPVVAGNFSVPFACSGLEMDIEGFSVKK
jgi:phenylalanyl-tRNA synthetase beta subunit